MATGLDERRGTAANHRTIDQIPLHTARRPGEIVGLKIGWVEVIDGQHNLIYKNFAAWDRYRTQLESSSGRGIRISTPGPVAWRDGRRSISTSIPAIRVDGSSTATTIVTMASFISYTWPAAVDSRWKFIKK